MRYLSLFSGVEAATLAWEPLGWEAVAFAEFDAFPSAVLAHHYPNIPNLGDVTQIEGSHYRGRVELIVGGSPCQGFSTAGNKKGLEDPRSGLALAYVRLLKEVRPKWFIWENVPGVLSTNGGNDFKAFLEAITEIGYSCAWRILDAQYVRVDGFPGAVPQRRRRLFVVGHIADWRYPAEVLFESEGVSGNSDESLAQGQTITGTAQVVARGANREVGSDTAVTLKIRSGCEGGGKGALWQVEKSATLSCHNDQTLFQPKSFPESSFGTFKKDHIAGTCRASGGALGGGSETLITHVKEFAKIDGNHPQDVRNKEIETRPTYVIAENTIGRQPQNGGNMLGISDKVSFALNATGVHGVCDPTLRVRRLTPVECERLMGFPDDYTKVPYRGKDAENCPDSPRYKACGNSMCVNVMRWIGQQIQACEKRHGGTSVEPERC